MTFEARAAQTVHATNDAVNEGFPCLPCIWRRFPSYHEEEFFRRQQGRFALG